jgi:hypothetical protein
MLLSCCLTEARLVVTSVLNHQAADMCITLPDFKLYWIKKELSLSSWIPTMYEPTFWLVDFELRLAGMLRIWPSLHL